LPPNQLSDHPEAIRFSAYIIHINSTNDSVSRSKLVDTVTAGSQKFTLWGLQRTPLGILRVKLNILAGFSETFSEGRFTSWNNFVPIFVPDYLLFEFFRVRIALFWAVMFW